MNFKTLNPALVIVDVQKAIDHPGWGNRNNPCAEQRIAALLDAWRQKSLPIFHIRHSSPEEGSPYRHDQGGYEFKPEVMPRAHEEVVTKHVNCAFIGADLDSRLQAQGVHELVVCGVITNNSVDATVRVASNLGFRVLVTEDAAATFEMTTREGKTFAAEDIHEIFLTNLHGEYAEVVTSERVVAALDL